MNTKELNSTVQTMLSGDRGLLAMDESIPTCHKRFAALGIPQTEEMRRAYRDLIVTTPGLGEAISGAILFDETIRQKTKDGRLFVDLLQKQGIVPGIKVDEGAHALAGFPGEKVTDGLDSLRGRLANYYTEGARFAKWRAVITIGEGIPTQTCYEVNAHALARYAALCQEAGIVPIVEPEVLMDGTHTIEQCARATEGVLTALFAELHRQGVVLEYTILKPNMVLSAINCPKQASVDEVADASVEVYKRTVPAAVPGIVFLSGGQPADLASARLNAIHVRHKGKLPWAVSFSYSRAVQQPCLELWAGKDANVAAAQKALYHRAKCNSAARRGEYTPALETQ
jgi:fructose-bisphosphate aldolase, class I